MIQLQNTVLKLTYLFCWQKAGIIDACIKMHTLISGQKPIKNVYKVLINGRFFLSYSKYKFAYFKYKFQNEILKAFNDYSLKSSVF